MKNYLQLEIEGKVYSLKFNIGTYKHVKNLTGQDPLKYGAASEEFDDVMAFTEVIFQAAVLSAGGSVTPEEAKMVVNELSAADVKLIIDLWNAPSDSKPSLNGEVSKHTQGDHVG